MGKRKRKVKGNEKGKGNGKNRCVGRRVRGRWARVRVER